MSKIILAFVVLIASLLIIGANLQDGNPLPPPVTPPPANGMCPLSFTGDCLEDNFIVSGVASVQSDGSIEATNFFSVKYEPDTTSTISKVEFYLNGVLSRSESVEPYTLFGDNNGDVELSALPSYPATLSVKVIGSSGQVLEQDSITIKGSAPTTPPPVAPPPVAPPPGPTPPPPAPGQPISGNNLLRNWDFSQGETGWSTFAGDTQVTNGVMRLNRVAGTINHFGQSAQPVRPGQTVTIQAKVRSGSRVGDAYNDGCGIGLDFREYNTGRWAIIGTLNGPATMSQDWAIITQQFTIPTRNRADAPLPSSSYSIIVESTGQVLQSSTGGGSRWGRSSNSDNGLNDPTNLPLYYQTHDYPQLMGMLEWNHNWHNTMSHCEFDWVNVSVKN